MCQKFPYFRCLSGLQKAVRWLRSLLLRAFTAISWYLGEYICTGSLSLKTKFLFHLLYLNALGWPKYRNINYLTQELCSIFRPIKIWSYLQNLQPLASWTEFLLVHRAPRVIICKNNWFSRNVSSGVFF